jgi:hypothetical protein
MGSKAEPVSLGQLVQGKQYTATGKYAGKSMSKKVTFLGIQGGEVWLAFVDNPSKGLRVTGKGPSYTIVRPEGGGNIRLFGAANSRSATPAPPNRSRAATPAPPNRSRAATPAPPNKSRSATPAPPNTSRSATPAPPNKSRAATPAPPSAVLSPSNLYRQILGRNCMVGLTAETRRSLYEDTAHASYADLLKRAEAAGCLSGAAAATKGLSPNRQRFFLKRWKRKTNNKKPAPPPPPPPPARQRITPERVDVPAPKTTMNRLRFLAMRWKRKTNNKKAQKPINKKQRRRLTPQRINTPPPPPKMSIAQMAAAAGKQAALGRS